MKDNTDKFIVTHYRSMSYGEMADKLGINKSTISRRAAALREAGELDEKPSGADMAQARAMHERLKGCTVDRADRLEALEELRELLHHDLTLAGGQGLARVSSEYRAVIAEMEALSIELGLTQNAGKDVSTIDLLRVRKSVQDEFEGDCDRDITERIVHSTYKHLADMDVMSYTYLDMLRAEANEYGKAIPVSKRAAR